MPRAAVARGEKVLLLVLGAAVALCLLGRHYREQDDTAQPPH